MCGIFGIVTKKQRNFDYSTFCTLGIANDRRGGDSCGIFIDGKVEYGVGEDKLFENFYLGSELLDNTRKSTIALGHCRKASVGKISKETAQPVVISNNDKIDFVVIHNGTIYNYQELANKYIPEVNITGMTDSQVMTLIFYHTGYDVLNEYIGGAVFVIVDYREKTPKTLLFKGASKEYKYSKEEKEERPLYYCINNRKKELVFSSIASYLLALRRDETVYIMPANYLFEFTGEDIEYIKKYPRTECTQRKPVVPTYTYFPFDNDCVELNTKYISVDFVNNLYTERGKKCMGRMYLGEYGYIYDKLTKRNKALEVWFYNGVALKNCNCFRFLINLKNELKLDTDTFCTKFENLIRYLSIDGIYSINGVRFKAISPTSSEIFTGTFQPLTVQTTNTYINGVFNSTSFRNAQCNMIEKLNQKLELDFKEIKEQCKL